MIFVNYRIRVLEVLEETLVLENPESTDDEIKKLQRFGISADNVFANAEFAKANEIGFPLLCDVNRSAISAYGLEIEDFGAPGYTACQRAVFVIEEDGVIGYAWIAENPGMEPDYDEVISFCSN